MNKKCKIKYMHDFPDYPCKLCNRKIVDYRKIVIMAVIVVLLIVWVYGLLSYKVSEINNITQDNCTMTSSVNNCIVLSNDK